MARALIEFGPSRMATDSDTPGTRGRSRLLWVLAGASAAGCAAAWWLPGPKPDTVLGRLNYVQFVFAVAMTGLFLSVGAVAFASPRRRRGARFGVAAVWLGVLVVPVPWEAAALFLPARHLMDNPWYVNNPRGLRASDDLPFERPAHLRWQGRSQGDLAQGPGEFDPYARVVRFETDFEGFRNGRDIREADVVFLGDSFTEAGNVPEEETFVQQVARQTGLIARNLGRAGYAPPAELVVLRKYGLRCRPHVVVWQIAESNDLEESSRFYEWLSSGRPYYQSDESAWSLRWQAWRRRSPTYRLYQLLRRRRASPLSGTFRDAEGRAHLIRFYEAPGPKQRPRGHPGWPLLADALRQGARLLAEDDIRLIVLLIPMKMRVMGPCVELSEETQRRLAGDWDLPESETLASHLKAECEKLGVTLVDATPQLKERAAAGQLVYLPLDTHLSPKGHAVIGELIVGAMSEAKGKGR